MWQFGIPEPFNASLANAIPLTFEAGGGSSLSNSLRTIYTYGPKLANSSVSMDRAVRLEAMLTQKAVELNVTCFALACNVTALRHVEMDAKYNSAEDRSYVVSFFLDHLTVAFPWEHLGTDICGIFEAYLYDPTQSPYTVLAGLDYTINLSKLSVSTFALRLAQVLNTYWMVDNYFVQAAGAFNASNSMLSRVNAVRTNSVTTTQARDILHCDRTWMALLCISTIFMLLAARASTVLGFLRLAPDATDFISALSLNNGMTLLPSASSKFFFEFFFILLLEAEERIRLLKDVRLKIGDVNAGEQIGRIVIGEDGTLGSLSKRRLYE